MSHRNYFRTALLAISIGALPVTTHAIDYSIYGQAGLFGLGGGLGIGLNDSFQARIGYGAFNYSISDIEDTDDETGDEVTYDADLKWSAGTALVDWYPFQGSFHLTAGAAINGSKIDVQAKPVSGVYSINGTDYTAAQVGKIDGSLDFGGTAPYLGIGWGHSVAADGHLSFLFDIGVIFSGKPDVSLKASCNASPAVCASLTRDVAEEERNLEEETEDFNVNPIINLAIGYTF